MSTAQQPIGSIDESSGDSTDHHPQPSRKLPIEETACGNSELAIERTEERESVEEPESINNVCRVEYEEENRDNQSKDNVEEQLKIDPENDEEITLRDSKTASGVKGTFEKVENEISLVENKKKSDEDALKEYSFLKKPSLKDIKPESGYIIYLVLLTRSSKFKLFSLIEQSIIPDGIPEQKRDGFYMVMTVSDDTYHLSLLILEGGGKIKEFFDPTGIPPRLKSFREEFAAINDVEIQSRESNTCYYHCIFYMALRSCNEMKDIIETFPSRKTNSGLEENDRLVISIGEKLVHAVKENELFKVYATVHEKICELNSTMEKHTLNEIEKKKIENILLNVPDYGKFLEDMSKQLQTWSTQTLNDSNPNFIKDVLSTWDETVYLFLNKLDQNIKDDPKIMDAVKEYNKGIKEFSIKNNLKYSE